MKFFQINASYKPAYIYGGPTMSVAKLSEELVKAGQDLEVLTTTANGDYELKIKPGEKILLDGVSVTYFRRITKDPFHFSPALLLSLWKKLRKPRSNFKTCKLIHIHAWWNMVSVCSCFIAIFSSWPIILSPRGTLSNYTFENRKSILKKVFHQLIGKFLLKRCHFHVTSEKEKQDILNLFHPRTITVLPNFVDLDHIPPIDYQQFLASRAKAEVYHSDFHASKPFRLLFLSRLEEKKGLDILLSSLKNIGIDYHLTIAGTGNPDYILFLKSMALKLGIEDNISWVGHQNSIQKFNLLASNELLVLPSHDESFANVVIESLSVGTPVLISSKVGLVNYVKNNNFGWAYSSKDELPSVIIEAQNNMNLRNTIRATAPNKIRVDYDVNHLVNSYLKMYDLIINSYISKT